jgi:hypothetical protein
MGVVPLRHSEERSAISVAAERLDVNERTLRSWAVSVKNTEFEPNWEIWEGRSEQLVSDRENRKETRDAAFWRKQAIDLQKKLADAEHIAEQLAGIRHQPIIVPPWTSTLKGGGKQKKAVIGLLVSDVHAGEVVRADELDGLNEFNLDVCRRRLRRLFSAACEIGPRWLSDCECQGAFLALGGDLISGSIHEELRMTNQLQDHGQVKFIVEELSIGIDQLIDKFGRVLIASVPGNHGRTTFKDTSKLYSNLNYDTFIADMIRDRYRNDGRIIFWGGYSTDQFVPIFNWVVHLTHGHKTGTGGGNGFAGPDLPIVRGGKKIAEQQGSVGRRIHLQLRGHLHYSTNPGRILSNGSIPGMTEYSRDLRAAIEPPRQWLFLLHEKWCLRERMDVQLEDPPVPEKMRVRVYV